MSLTAKLRILLVDDRTVVREGLAGLIDSQPEFEVVGQASAPADAVRLAVDPDVIVTEIEFSSTGHPTTVVTDLRSSFSSSGILVLTNNSHPATIEEVLAGGADGYLLKTSATDELVTGIRTVSGGRRYLQPSLAANVARSRWDTKDGPLSPREEEVLCLIAAGHTNASIARQLATSLRTVETQRARVMQKLGLTTRAELFAYALRTGLIGGSVPRDTQA